MSTVYGKQDDLNLGFTADDVRAHVLENRARLVESLMPGGNATLTTLSQVHSAKVHRVSGLGPVEAGDGMLTNEPGKLLAILTADCVPVLVVDGENRAIASFHAGWRGTVQQIVQVGIDKMEAEFGSKPESLSAVIGPCIGGCCYEIGEEVQNAFTSRFSYANEIFMRKTPTSLHLNLVAANLRQLVDAGLAVANIYVMDQCTSCHPERFFSYRKSGGRTGRMMSVIGIRQDSN